MVAVALKLLKVQDRSFIIYKQTWWRTWLFGFFADFIGVVGLLFFVLILPNIGYDEYNPFANAQTLLIHLAFIVFSSFLIYLFNVKTFKKTVLSLKASKRVALYLAIWTAPCFILIPTVWIL